PQNDVTLKMPAFEWVHVQLHQQKGMISLSPPTICNSATAKDMGWNYRVMSDREWAGRYALVLNPGVNGVYLLRTNLDAAFDDNGQQTNPLTVRLTGNVTGIMKLLNRCGWQAEPESDASLPHQFSLMARQGVPGKGD
ncbi:hypothetical protein AB8R82_26900, partial [Klebsiella pneumoniae]